MKPFLLALCVFALALPALAADPTPTPTATPASTPKPKPKLKLAADKLPAGHDTPEGVTCDLVRAFIHRDPELFKKTCLPVGYGAGAAKGYREFQDRVIASMKEEAAKKEPSPGGPKSVGKLFAARHLTMNGPASYGYAGFGYREVMFVDVGVISQNGKLSLTRMLVIQEEDGKWYAYPAPSLSPLLSAGLNEEKPSTRDFTEAYDIETDGRTP